MDPSLDARSDEVVLNGCLNGDRSCQEVFVRRYSNLVFATIQRVLKVKNIHLSQQSVEDLHQTVFLHLFEKQCRKLRLYKGRNGCTLASWIRMLSSRIVLDHLRRGTDALAHRHRTVSLEFVSEMNAPELSALDRLAAVEQWDQIESALRRLQTRDQLMIRLYCIEGRPLSKVAQVLGISSKNIHSVKHRAIQRLKTEVETCKQ